MKYNFILCVLLGCLSVISYSDAETITVMTASEYAAAQKIGTEVLKSAYQTAAKGEQEKFFKMLNIESKEGGMDSELWWAISNKTQELLIEGGKKAKEEYEADPFNSDSLEYYLKKWISGHTYSIFSSECEKAGYPYLLFTRQGSDLLPKNHNCFQTKEQCFKFADKMETSDDFRTGGELEKGRINCCLSHEDVVNKNGEILHCY